MTANASAIQQPSFGPQHTISPRRDRLQSLLLTALVGIAVAAASILALLAATDESSSLLTVLGISAAFAALTLAVRAATPLGAFFGGLACFCVTWWTRIPEHPIRGSALLPLAAVVVLTFVATRAGRQPKEHLGLAERRSGRRASQVLANLGAAALAPTPLGAYIAGALGLPLPVDPAILACAALAALAEATADTVSSEIGQAFGETTYMVTSLQRVRRGTDGGISLTGTITGLAAALAVVSLGAWALQLALIPAGITFIAAAVGLFADSLLGATIERLGWIGNDLVNFTSTAIAAVVALLLLRL